MTDLERYNLWQNTEIAKINPNITLVRNKFSGGLMIQSVHSKDNFPTMQLLCGINCKNLMKVYDTVQTGDKCVSLCEYIEGNTLEYFVENTKPYDEQQVRNIMCQLCDGLTALHNNMIIHRDINPSNVMLDKNGVVKIIDYDISRTAKAERSKDTRILGTAGYASPEQFGFHQTSCRADIYSCGVLMNYLLTGKLPDEQTYRGKLTPIIEKCMEIDEKNRYDSAEILKYEIFGGTPPYNRNGQKSSGGFFANLPGFRTNKRYKKIIACICYGYYFLFLFTFLMTLFTGAKAITPSDIGCALTIFIFWTAIPFLCFFDPWKISRFIPIKDPKGKKNFLIIIGIISLVIGFVSVYLGSLSTLKSINSIASNIL